MNDIFKYDARRKEIGRRIKKERKRLALTQSDLAAKISTVENSTGAIGQSTVASWENMTTIPPLSRLIILSDIFDCDISYLLGDIETRKWETTDIKKYIGLSSGAIDALHTAYQCDNTNFDAIQLISYLIERIDFKKISRDIYEIAILTALTIQSAVIDVSALSQDIEYLRDGRIALPPEETREYRKEQIIRTFSEEMRQGISLVAATHLPLPNEIEKAASGSTKNRKRPR